MCPPKCLTHWCPLISHLCHMRTHKTFYQPPYNHWQINFSKSCTSTLKIGPTNGKGIKWQSGINHSLSLEWGFIRTALIKEMKFVFCRFCKCVVMSSHSTNPLGMGEWHHHLELLNANRKTNEYNYYSHEHQSRIWQPIREPYMNLLKYIHTSSWMKLTCARTNWKKRHETSI